MIEQNEDEIIASGLNTILEGITSGDFQKVCDGYNSITGEEVEPPEVAPKLTKLQRIKALRDAKLPKENKKPTEKPSKKKPPQNDEEVTDSEIIEIKGEGGKIFGRGEITFITVPEDEQTQAANKLVSRKKLRLPRVSVLDTEKTRMSNPDGSVHLDLTNRKMKD